MKRQIKVFFQSVVVFFAPIYALGFELSVVDVRRNITLSNDEIPYKDFYISGEGVSGLKKNLIVTAVRKINVRDASGAQAIGEINVPVGQLKIIAVYGNVAVARENILIPRDDQPMLEQIGIMSGDVIDLKFPVIKIKPVTRKVSSVEVKSEAPSTNPEPVSKVSPEFAMPAPEVVIPK